MLSVVGEGRVLANHGGLLKEQQVLVGPHPLPSWQFAESEHKKGSVYTFHAKNEDVMCTIRMGFATPLKITVRTSQIFHA